MDIDHSGPHVVVAQEFPNRPPVVVAIQRTKGPTSPLRNGALLSLHTALALRFTLRLTFHNR
jgi:hypothetical protein